MSMFASSLPLSISHEAEDLTISRLDVELALQTGSPALWNSDAVPVNPMLGDFNAAQDQHATGLFPIMLDALNFANLLNSRENEDQEKLDPLSYMELQLSLIYRLIEASPLGQPRCTWKAPHDDVAHLAMLAFMTTLLPEYHSDHSNYLVLSVRLRSAIQDLQRMSADDSDSDGALLLWALSVAGISIWKRDYHRWLSSMIWETCGRLGLREWPAVHDQLCAFPWIHVLHDVPARSLWDGAQRMSTIETS